MSEPHFHCGVTPSCEGCADDQDLTPMFTDGEPVETPYGYGLNALVERYGNHETKLSEGMHFIMTKDPHGEAPANLKDLLVRYPPAAHTEALWQALTEADMASRRAESSVMLVHPRWVGDREAEVERREEVAREARSTVLACRQAIIDAVRDL